VRPAGLIRGRAVAFGTAGWRVALVWECTLRKSNKVQNVAEIVVAWLTSATPILEVGSEQLGAKSYRIRSSA
jgi:DNA mismatch endonuclease (patch repair protein)